MEKFVIVSVSTLEDLCELSERAVTQLKSIQPHDPLNMALAGAISEIRTRSILEPAIG